MGDIIRIKNIEFINNELFAIDVYNETQNTNSRIFISKDDLKSGKLPLPTEIT